MDLNKRLLLSFITVLTVLLIVSSVSANENATVLGDDSDTVYVDDINGNDANAGSTNESSLKSISKAVEASHENSTIILNDGTYTGSKNTRITIDKALTFEGRENTVIDGENTNYIFTITNNAKVTFKNIKFISAYKSPESYSINYPDSVYGSAIEIRNANVIIDNCAFENNQVAYSTNNHYTYGGAVSNFGNLTISNSRFTSNIAHSTSGLFSYGGAIYNKGNLTISKSRITDVNADPYTFGGLIANDGILTITDSLIGNATVGGESRGAAIYNTGTMNMHNSVVENNTASKTTFQYIYGAIYTSGVFNGYSNIFKNNTALYSVPSRGSPTIYSVGDLNLTYNLFLANVPFDDVSTAIYLNSLGDISLDNNWWGSNDDPYLTNAFNIYDSVHSWLILNLTPEYAPLQISENVDITAKWASNIGMALNYNLIPKSKIKINNHTFDLVESLTYTYSDTQNKGMHFVAVDYYNFTQIVEVDVGKTESRLNVNLNNTLTYLDDLVIAVKVLAPDDIPEGIILIDIGDKTYNATLENGRVNYVIPEIKPGEYDVKITYNGSEEYFKSFYTSKVTVNKKKVDINLTIEDVYFDESALARITLSPAGSKSTAYLTVNGKRKITYLYDDRINELSLGYFSEGTYEGTLTYMNNEYFESDPVTITFKVKRYETSLNLTAPDIKLGETQVIKISITPNDLSGYATIRINDYAQDIFIENGSANITIPNLQAGKYEVKVEYEGDDKYAPETAEITFSVLKTPSSLDVTVNYNDTTLKGSIHVKTNARNCTGEVEVYINYKIYRINLTNGEAAFQVNYDKGTNYIYVYYGGDSYWAESEWNTTIGVADEFVFMSEDVEGYEHNNFNYLVRLIEINGVPLPLRPITISFNNEQFNVTTNDNGYAYFKLNLPIGKYSISANYKNQTITNNVTVKKIDFSITSTNNTYGENTTFRAMLDRDVNGRFKFRINDKQAIVEIINGTAEYSMRLNAGEHVLYGNYVNDYFNSTVKNINFEVKKADSILDFIVGNVITGDDANLTVTLSDSATGNVTFILDGAEQVIKVDDNKAYITVLNITGGNHTIKISYSGDENFNENAMETTFYIKDLRTRIILNTADITYGESLFVNVKIDDNATGNITFTIGEYTKTVDVDKGVAVLKLDNLNAGKYTVNAVYNGNMYYISSNASDTFIVYKADSTIRIEADAILDENVLIYAYLSPNATGKVSFSMPGYYTSRNKEISDAIALWYISPLKTGSYTVIAQYLGDNNYNPSNTTHVINISEVKTKLTVSIPDTTINERVTVNVKLTTSDGEGLTGRVIITINSRNYPLNVRNGTGSLVIGKFNIGDYDFTAKYAGEDIYNPAFAEGSFKVAENLPVMLKVKNITKYFSKPEKLEVTLTDSNSNPLQGETIHITLNNKQYVLTTDDDGKVYLSADFNIGNYTAMISYEGSDKYISQSANASITIKSTVEGTDLVKQVGTSQQYFAIFLDSNGRALSNSLVTFIIGDKSLTASTLPNGISRLNINLNPGYYLIMAVNPVTMEYTINSIFIYDRLMENKDLTQLYTAGNNYKVRAYTSNGNITGAGEKVKFTIAGKTINVKTDKNGYASFKINLKPGTYAITATYAGVTVKNKIVVKSIIKAKNYKVKKSAKKLKIKVSLKKVNGKYLKGKKIIIKFKGKKYAAKTNKKGVAIFKIKKNVLKKLKKSKKYTYKVTYLKDTVKKTIKVKK